jgi:hypothetical protein
MATAASARPRRDMYLSVLAARAMTALGRLATDTSCWNDQIESGLRDGISYCHAVRLKAPEVLSGTSLEEWRNAVKRSVQNLTDKTAAASDAYSESGKVETILKKIATRKYTPNMRDLVIAIEFLRKTATDR